MSPGVTTRADLHVHSRFSDQPRIKGLRMLRGQESYSEPLDIYRLARAHGMDFVTITDHNSLAGSLAIAHLPGTFLSTEFDTWFPENGCRVHVVASGIDERTFQDSLRARESVYDLVACLREAGVTHFLAHPLFDMDGRLTPDIVEKCLLLFNVLEARNGSRTSRCNGLLREIVATLTPQRLAAMAERQGVAPFGATPWRKSLVGGSDDHSGLFVAGASTVVTGDGSLQDFLAALERGDCAPGGDDGDARLLAHSIYAASFWRVREILRLDEQDPGRGTLGVLRRGFGRIGREVPVLEKTMRGVRSMAPGLYQDGDPRGPEWDKLLETSLGPLAGTPDGIAAVGAKELNARLFGVVSRLADDVQALHLSRLRPRVTRPRLKRILLSSFAVGMVQFLELPYFMAWHLQSRDRGVQAGLRERFVAGAEPNDGPAGEQRSAPPAAGRPLRLMVLTEAAPSSDGAAFDPGRLQHLASAGLEVRVLTLAASEPGLREDGKIVYLPPLAEWPRGGGRLRVPPLLDLLDHLEESGTEALHVTGPGPMGLAGLLAARLLHVPVSGACDDTAATCLAMPPASPSAAARVRYLRWFYTRIDAVGAPDRAAARGLIAAGVDPSRVHVVGGRGIGSRPPVSRPAASGVHPGVAPRPR